jgi:hypothetical protein
VSVSPEVVRLVLLLVAGALFVVGTALIYPPAAWFVAGGVLVFLAFFYDLEGSPRETRPPRS